ncbi:SDR family oxidoreductase [Nonomuraea fuscirosea]|uniref:NAD(P)-dependent oxidoreductase n=1 Tax=Nonomuraea fuscirosea TaxID=1291556 RepID=UPI002DD9CDB8|nr:SDR family oxidoreductase [Nonomuraea fuscirosea]WSA55156.1 SDR family oxidoreductase [Nonomuraea fuscirosea]
MKIAVFGATGATGRLVVVRALEAGHEVRAMVRDSARLPISHERLHVVVGELADQGAVDATVDGRDVVISALAGSARQPACTDGVRAILAAMRATSAVRLLVVSAHGAAESRDHSPYVMAVRTLLSAKMRDKDTMETLIRQADDLRWTIVRPPALTHSPRTGRYRVGTELKITLASRISRADLADFLLRAAAEDVYVGQAPRIAA